MNLIYCDESCHLRHDNSNVMVLGGIDIPEEYKNRINNRIKRLKEESGLHKNSEIKWTKISSKYFEFYKSIIDYLMEEDKIKIRILVANNKKELEHDVFNQSHDDWYNKIYWVLLKEHLKKHNEEKYKIFLDIKDTLGGPRTEILKNCFNSAKGSQNVVGVYQINSNESQILQGIDLLIGLCSYFYRYLDGKNSSKDNTKNKLVNYFLNTYNVNLKRNSSWTEDKFNLFIWEPNCKRGDFKC